VEHFNKLTLRFSDVNYDSNLKENGETSRYLMAVNVPAVSTEECRKAYGQNAITTRMICAGFPEGGKDSCQVCTF
jgi:hypothetical protein